MHHQALVERYSQVSRDTPACDKALKTGIEVSSALVIIVASGSIFMTFSPSFETIIKTVR